MRKLILKLLLLIAGLLVCTNASAYDFKVDGIAYYINSDGKSVSVTTGCSVSDVVIPSSVKNGRKTYTVTSIEESAFENYTITSIVIPDEVTSIGAYAFKGCEYLESVTLPSKINIINRYLFAYCSSLTSIIIPDGVTLIGEYAFSWCNNLTSIDIPDSVTSIGVRAFEDCRSLTSIVIPDGVTTIGACAFRGCSGLTSMVIPKSVTEIGEGAFQYCSGLMEINVDSENQNYASFDGVLYTKDLKTLIFCPQAKTSVTFPDALTIIDENAFSSCYNLTSIAIPKSVTEIGEGAFQYCSNLMEINVDSENQNYASFDGVLYSKDLKTLIFCPQAKTSVTLPDALTIINESTFSNCYNLTSIAIPKSVTSIGEGAFQVCFDLMEINVDSENQNYASFDGILYSKDLRTLICCPQKLLTVSILDSVTTIGDYAFYSCTGLTSIVLPDGVTSIGACAFSSCMKLSSIVIPNGVTAIYDETFQACFELVSVRLPNVTTIGNNVFNSCYELNSIELSNNLSAIGECAFYSCTKLASIELPDNLNAIGENAFGNCENLSSIKLPNGLTSISVRLFSNCYNLTSITIPESVVSIESGAFSYCDKIVEINSLNPEPPVLFNDAFSTDPTTCTLNVPVGSKAAYQNADVWSKFYNINENIISNVEKIAVDNDVTISVDGGSIIVNGLASDATIEVYNTAGQMLYCGTETSIPVAISDIYIVKVQNKTFKVALK